MGDFEYRVLGPIQVLRGQRAVPIDAPRQRAVLASLLLEANRVSLYLGLPERAPRAIVSLYDQRPRVRSGSDGYGAASA